MRKRIFKLTGLFILLSSGYLRGQTSDLQQKAHERIQYFQYGAAQGKDLEDTKKVFEHNSPDEVANAMIAELNVDRGTVARNDVRDVAVSSIFKALNLPLAPVCVALKSAQSPQRKAQLITVLRGLSTPEVTNALLAQLKDRRPAVDYIGWPEEPVKPLRVCDVACDALYYNLGPKGSGRRIGYTSDYDRRDEIIKQTLKELKLETPQ